MIEDICMAGQLIPVIEIGNADDAKPLAEALLSGGIRVIEITLRTTDALKAIEQAATVDGMIVGAGTLLEPAQVASVQNAGAKFGVSPGSTSAIVEACKELDFPFLPGVSTVTEVMELRSLGYHVQKFFPAEAAGGRPMLKSIAGPIHDLKFCPTGGVSLTNAPDYLVLPNVICVGGSWVAPRSLIEAKDWKQIEANAREAASLKTG